MLVPLLSSENKNKFGLGTNALIHHLMGSGFEVMYIGRLDVVCLTQKC